MPAPTEAARFCEIARDASSMAELTTDLTDVALELGFSSVTLAHHVDPGRHPERSVAFIDLSRGLAEADADPPAR